jgi:hypothetical protein
LIFEYYSNFTIGEKGLEMDNETTLVKRPTIITLRNDLGTEWEFRSDLHTMRPEWTQIWSAIRGRPNDEIEYISERRAYRKTYKHGFFFVNEYCDVIIEEPCTSLIAPDHPQAELFAKVFGAAFC